MTVEQLLNEVDRLGIEMMLSHWVDKIYANKPWYVSLTRSVEGTTLKVDAHGTDIHTVLLDAVGKFTRAMHQGIPELKPALEYTEEAAS
jgi:hypothetical protein